MVGDKVISLASKVREPEDTFNIKTQNRDFGTERFSRKESDLFEAQFNTLINDLDSRLMTDIFMQRQDEIALAAAHAKLQFDEKLFGGVNAADGEIGFDLIRPGHVRSNPADGTAENTWIYEHTADGWNDWIGDGTSGDDYAVSEDQVILVLGMVDSGAMIIDENTGSLNTLERENFTPTSGVNVDRFGRNVDMLPKDTNNGRIGDNDNDILTQSLPTMLGTDRDRVHLRLRSDVPQPLADANAQVFSEPRLLGVTFGVGTFMNNEDY